LDKVRSLILALPESEFLGYSCAFKVPISSFKEDSCAMFKKKPPNLIVLKKPVKLFSCE